MVLSNDMKKAIAFGLICGAIISILSVFGYCSEQETIVPTTIDNVAINGTGQIIEYNGAHLYYIHLEPGYTYFFNNNATQTSMRVLLSNSIDVGTQGLKIDVAPSSSYSVAGSGGYAYFSSNGNVQYFTFTREEMPGLPNFVDNIAYSLSYVNLNQIVNNVVPILAISVLVGLGVYLVKRVINRMKKAKGGV